jgi:hypothetical protein
MATRQSNNEDERTKIGGAADVRGDRGAEENDREGTGLTSDDDFEKFMEAEFTQTALPNPPGLNGMHLVWLTTASQYDSIQKRQRLGYTPVRQSEMPGFDASNGQSLAGYDGNVTCNEMVLFKIPQQRYQQIMGFYHHKKPLEEEEGVIGRFNDQGERLTDSDDGVAAMEKEAALARRKVPTFL